jgi:hypothetical protein
MLRALVSRLRPWTWLWPYLAVAIVFVVSRMFYRGTYNLRFDASPLFYFIQYIDPWFIEHDFLRSILYLHQQAPIPNLVVGTVWLTFGELGWFYVVDGILVAWGLILYLALTTCLIRFNVPRVVTFVVVALFMSTPVAVLYEMWLFYHIPVAALLLCSVLALFRFYRLGTLRSGMLFFGLLASVALIRNVYGSVWLVAIAAILLVVPPLVAPKGSTARRTILKAAAIPLLLLVAMGAKTTILMGRGFGDAAVWTNIVYKTWPEVPSAERERLEQEGLVSGSVSYEPFTGVDNLKSMRVEHEATGIPLLDIVRLPSGRGNTHTLEYLLIADKYYKADGKYLLDNYPDAYARSVVWALTNWYVSSPTRDIVMPVTQNYLQVKQLDASFNAAFLAGDDGELRLLFVLLPAALLYGLYRVLRLRALLASERSTVVGILFMLLTIVYAALGTTMVSSGDFSRYRFDVDPFYLILLVMMATHSVRAVTRWARRFRQRRRAAPPQGAAATA